MDTADLIRRQREVLSSFAGVFLQGQKAMKDATAGLERELARIES